ncbi:AAA family ATPase [Rhodalgimonas zhirmunskyi]|uniref:AAA family ATPase n=1 Tax=Rhodalgimonas zhirmunskyi TaxID=2964767 RepID=A0AAJ1X5H5_9RHOB|nr:AAA family ATPase [Rhodoalgimonas zhirmunskyi]MDQ2094536.1 AAA family ATPase [Rhodoalgimonas zhirmunskyi]
MRLNRLDLTRYGKFTDVSLTFPHPVQNGPDLHVIYGANEAGKSTLLEAWLDLLFQIPVRSTMGFIHPYQSMRLGAQLEIDNRLHEIVRIKKRDNSLLDANDAPLGEALLHGGLRGLDRASYAAMFSLNGQTLNDGGESILASKGDLGELLFQASAGLADLAGQLEALNENSEAFLNRTGRKGKLRELVADFDELGRQVKDLDTAAAEYKRLSTERDRADEAWKKAREAAEHAQVELIETERRIEARPLLARLERHEAAIATYGPLPEPPEGWLEELPLLDRQETAISTRLETARHAVKSLQDDLKNMPPDQAALDAKEAVEGAEQLKSAHDTALNDLPKRQSELDIVAGAVNECLARLGQGGVEPAVLMPEAAVIGRLRELIEQHSGVKTARESAVLELEEARAEQERAIERLRQAGGSASDQGGLPGLVQKLRREDPDQALRRAEANLIEADARVQSALSAMSPWTGNIEDLVRLNVPERAVLKQLDAQIKDADRLLERAQDRVEQAEQDMAQARARKEAIASADTVTLEEAAQVRTQREAEWSRHRSALTDETALSFEAAMRLDDQVTATLAHQRAHEEMTAGAARALAEAELQLESALKYRTDALARRNDLSQRLGGIVANVSPALPAKMELPEFEAWIDRFDVACAAQVAREKAVREHSLFRQESDRALADICEALRRAGHEIDASSGLAFALETAQSLLDRATRIEALREAEGQARQDVARRARTHATAEAALEEWQAAWNNACSNTWMAGASLGVAEMRAILEELDRLQAHHARMVELTHRIATMQANQNHFEQSVRSLATRLDLDESKPVPELWRGITNRLQAADARENQRAILEQKFETARQSLAKIESEATLHSSRTSEFARYFGVETWADARDSLARAGDLSKLHEARRDVIEDLCVRMHCQTIDEVRDDLESTDTDALEARAESLRADLKALRSAQEEAQDTFRKAEEAVDAVGGDDAVARLEERRQTLLLEMEEGARKHLRQRLGLLAVDAALRRYRDTHRSGMLDRASESFRVMSRDRYSGLAASFDGNHEVLVALGAEGGSKHADQLSEGTRAQLYLALRIAGYHEFVRNNGPVPFIADDIMESFDDSRATEAFALMAQMSEQGQVIYLTHHAHLCEIVRRVCPSVHIHELPE